MDDAQAFVDKADGLHISRERPRWWWWWLPSLHGKWSLEKRRIEALSNIAGEQINVELMAQRPRRADDVLNNALLAEVLKALAEIQEKAEHAIYKDDLDDLSDDAESQGQFRAYLCPLGEIRDEGILLIDLMEEWNVPKAVISKLRDSLGKKLEGSDTNPDDARAVLRALFEESDSWADYTDDYEKTMRRYTHWLFWSTVALIAVAVLSFYFAFRFPLALLPGLLCAGAAGSCVSVMSKMPALDVTLSGELEAYGRRILSRIAVGIVASLIGCALLSIFPVAIQNQTFADALTACTAASCTPSPVAPCAGMKSLLLLGLPMLLGFSERTLTSFEQRFWGQSRVSRKH
jgi:hypothetical protein